MMKAKLKILLENELKLIRVEIERLSNTEVESTSKICITKAIAKIEKLQERIFRVQDTMSIINGEFDD